MDSDKRRNAILIGLAVVGLVVAAFFLYRDGDDTSPPEDVRGGIYYTGPMKSKTQGSNVYATPDGTKMTPEEAKAAAERWQQANADRIKQLSQNR